MSLPARGVSPHGGQETEWLLILVIGDLEGATVVAPFQEAFLDFEAGLRFLDAGFRAIENGRKSLLYRGGGKLSFSRFCANRLDCPGFEFKYI